MSKDSHNLTASNPNGSLAPNEPSETEQGFVIVSPVGEGFGRIAMPADKTCVTVNEEPTEREILTAMVSELMAESIRVTACNDDKEQQSVSCAYCGEVDRVLVTFCNPAEQLDFVEFGLYEDDAAEKLTSLIARVSALGAES